jgi:hypothetical protein
MSKHGAWKQQYNLKKYGTVAWPGVSGLPICPCGYRWPSCITVDWIVVPLKGKPMENVLHCPDCRRSLVLKFSILDMKFYDPDMTPAQIVDSILEERNG